MPLPSSHGTEQVQFIDMMLQRDRTSNLRYLLRHSDPRNHIKRFHRARTCASFFSTWRMTSSSKIPMRWPNAEVCTARIFSVITQLILIKPFCVVGGTLTRVVISSDVKEVIRHTTVESNPRFRHSAQRQPAEAFSRNHQPAQSIFHPSSSAIILIDKSLAKSEASRSFSNGSATCRTRTWYGNPLIFIKGRDEHTQRISRGKTELLCRFTELFRLIIINTCRKLNYYCHSNHYFLSFYILLTCFANIPYLDY